MLPPKPASRARTPDLLRGRRGSDTGSESKFTVTSEKNVGNLSRPDSALSSIDPAIVKVAAAKKFHRMMSPPPQIHERDPKAAANREEVGTGRQFLWSSNRIHELESQLNRAVAEKRTLQQERLELEDRLIRALSDFSHVESERRQLDDRVREAHEAMRSLQSRLDSIHGEVAQREAELQRTLQQVQQESRGHVDRAGELQTHLDLLQQELQDRDKAVEELTERLGEAEFQLQQLKTGMRALEAELDHQSETFAAALAHHERDAALRTDRLTELEAERAGLLRSLEEARLSRDALERQVGELRSTASPLTRLVKTAQGEHQQALDELDALRSDLEAAEGRARAQEEELKALRIQVYSLNDALQTLQGQREASEEQLARAEAAADRARAHVEELQSRVQQADRLLAQTNERVFALETEKEALQRKVETLEGARVQLQGEVRRLETELEEAGEAQLALRSDLASAQSSIVRLQRDLMNREDRAFELEDYRRNLSAAEQARVHLDRQLQRSEKAKQEVERALLTEKRKVNDLQVALEEAERKAQQTAEAGKRHVATVEAAKIDVQRSLQRAESARTDALQMLEIERRRSQQMELQVSNAEMQIRRLQDAKAILEGNLADAEKGAAEAQGLRAQLAARDAVNSDLQLRVQELELELNRSKQRASSSATAVAGDAISSLESDRELLTTKLAAARAERQTFQSRAAELEQTVSELRAERESLRARITGLEHAVLERKGKEQDTLRDRVAELERSTVDLRSSRDALQGQLRQLEKSAQELRGERDGFQQQCVVLEREVAALKQAAAALQAEVTAAKEAAAAAAAAAVPAHPAAVPTPQVADLTLDELRSENQTLLAICDKLKEQYLKTEEARKALEVQMAVTAQEHAEMKEGYEVLKGRLEVVLDRNQGLQEALDERLAEKGGKATDALANAKTEALTAQRRLQSLEEEVVALRESEVALRQALELEQATCEELSKEVEALKQQQQPPSQQQEEGAAPAGVVSELQGKLAQAEGDKAKLLEAVRQLNAVVDEERATVASLEGRIAALLGDVERARSDQAALRRDKERLEAMNREMSISAVSDRAMSQVAALTKEKEGAERALEASRAELANIRSQLDRLYEDNVDLKMRLADAERRASASASDGAAATPGTSTVMEIEEGRPSAAKLMGSNSQRSLALRSPGTSTPTKGELTRETSAREREEQAAALAKLQGELKAQTELAAKLAEEKRRLEEEHAALSQRSLLATLLGEEKARLEEALEGGRAELEAMAERCRELEEGLHLAEAQLEVSAQEQSTVDDVVTLQGALEAANARIEAYEDKVKGLEERVKLYEEASKVAELAAEDARNPQASLKAALEIQVQLQERIQGLEWALDRYKSRGNQVPEQTVLQIQLLQSEIVRLQELNNALETEVKALRDGKPSVSASTSFRVSDGGGAGNPSTPGGTAMPAPSSAAQRLRRISSKLKEGFESLGQKLATKDGAAESTLPPNVPITELHRARDITGSLLKDKLLLEQCVKYLVSSHPNKDALKSALPASPGPSQGLAAAQDAVVARILTRIGQATGTSPRPSVTYSASERSLSQRTIDAGRDTASTAESVPAPSFEGSPGDFRMVPSPMRAPEEAEASTVPTPPFITPPLGGHGQGYGHPQQAGRGRSAVPAHAMVMSPSTPIGNFRSLSLSPDKTPENLGGSKRSILSPEKTQDLVDISLSSPADARTSAARTPPEKTPSLKTLMRTPPPQKSPSSSSKMT